MRTANVSRQSLSRAVRPDDGVARLVRKCLDTLVLWQRRADDRRHLEQMSSYMYRDIGLDWLQARNEARKPFWRA